MTSGFLKRWYIIEQIDSIGPCSYGLHLKSNFSNSVIFKFFATVRLELCLTNLFRVNNIMEILCLDITVFSDKVVLLVV